MKNLLRTLLCVMCLCSVSQLHSQVESNPLVITPEEYQTLKESGQANGIFHIEMNVSQESQKGKPADIRITSDSKMLGGGGGDECACIQPLDESFDIVPFTNGQAPEYRNDDGSTALIELPFTFCLYGQNYTSCYINNNGNVSFGSPYGTFSASAFPSAQYVMVAPFWADVDTRNSESGLVHYRLTPTSLTVFWDRVGYFNNMADKLNTFQLIITNGQDPIIPGDANVSFCYADMEWTTGSASGGIDGFGGTPATVGCNKGDGVNFIQIGRFDHEGVDYDGPGGNADGVSWLDNLIFTIDACTSNDATNVPPLTPSLSLCETIYICQNSEISLQFLGPENNQTITLEYEIPAEAGLTSSVITNPGSTQLNITAGPDSNLGSYTFTVVATDNGTPALSTQVIYTIVVIDVPEEIQISGVPAICSGESTFLSIPTGYTNIEWSNGAASNTISVDQPGTYSVTASLGGCETSGSIVVSVAETPVPVISGETPICAGTTTELSLNDDFTTITWSTGSAAPSIEVGAGNYTVTVTNDLGCPGTDSYSVANFPVPLLPQDFFECDLSANINSNDVPGLWTYTSSDGELTFAPGTQSADVAITASAYGVYNLTYTDNECQLSDSITVTFYPVPSFVLADTLVCLGSTVVLDPQGSFDNAFTWEWSTAESTPTITIVADSLISQISWSASNPCGQSSGVVTVQAEPCEIIIPNVFTPNNDALNNAFVIENIDKYPGSTLRVYNRWGTLLFESDSYRNNWVPREEEAPEGTYYFILGWKRSDGMQYFEGHVTLLR
jgi:gliding motility-associated-like protein